MSVQGGHGGAKFSIGHMLSFFNGIRIPLAGNGFYAEAVKKIPPKCQVFIEMEGCRNSDDTCFTICFSGCIHKGLFPFFQQIKAGTIVIDVVLRIVISAAQKSISHCFAIDRCNGYLAMIRTMRAYLRLDGYMFFIRSTSIGFAASRPVPQYSYRLKAAKSG